MYTMSSMSVFYGHTKTYVVADTSDGVREGS